MSMSALVPPFRTPIRRQPGSFRTLSRLPRLYRVPEVFGVGGGITAESSFSVQKYVAMNAAAQKMSKKMKTLGARPCRISHTI